MQSANRSVNIEQGAVMKKVTSTHIEGLFAGATAFTGRRLRAGVSLSALFFFLGMAPVWAQAPAGKDLRVFYQQNCTKCHGPDGSAVSAEGEKLRGRDLTDPEWQRETRDDQMVKTILKGKFFGLAMPAFKDTLTEDEAQHMVTDIIRQSQKGQVIAPEVDAAVKK